MARVVNKPAETERAVLPDNTLPAKPDDGAAEQGGETVSLDLAAKVSETVKPPETAKQKPPKENKPVTKIHIDEFLLTSGLRPEQRAGFKTYAGVAYNSEEGWKKSLSDYQNREYRRGTSK